MAKIRSHKERVKDANTLLENGWNGRKVSVFDREAFVELFLVEDILETYKIRLLKEQKSNPRTRAGQIAKDNNIRMYVAIVNLLFSVVDVSKRALSSDNNRAISKAIPEHKLYKASGVKCLPELRALCVNLLRDIVDAAVVVESNDQKLDEELNNIEAHGANARKIYDIPYDMAGDLSNIAITLTEEEIKEIEKAIAEADDAIKDKNKNKNKRDNNPNIY